MAVIKTNAGVMPIGGQGMGGKTRHSNALQLTIPAGNIASGDTMVIGHLPNNCRVLDITIKNKTGVSLTFSVGTAATNATYFRASSALADGAVSKSLADAGAMELNALYPTTPMIATFGAAATVPAGASLLVAVEYILDEPFRP